MRRGRDSARRWPRACDEERVREAAGGKGNEPSSPQEHAMMIAFALAIVGAMVLASIEIAAHAHAPAGR